MPLLILGSLFSCFLRGSELYVKGIPLYDSIGHALFESNKNFQRVNKMSQHSEYSL